MPPRVAAGGVSTATGAITGASGTGSAGISGMAGVTGAVAGAADSGAASEDGTEPVRDSTRYPGSGLGRTAAVVSGGVLNGTGRRGP